MGGLPQDADRRARAQDWFLAAARFSGRRSVPNIAAPRLRRIQKQLDIQFPHFKEITSHLCAELMLAMASAQSSFRVSPILLHGGPGIGKTTYAMALANALGVGSQVISAGGSQGSFDICGTSAHWSNASVGKVFSLLAHTDSAAAVLVIDELDKINGDERYSPIPVLLDLLEVQSARRFMDEALGMRFDASKLIVVATANDIESIPAPLRSRLHPVCLASPTALEKRKIAERMLQDLKRGLGRKLSCDPAMLDELSNSSGDLREMARNLRFTVGQALVKGKRNVSVSDLIRNKVQLKGSIGFLN